MLTQPKGILPLIAAKSRSAVLALGGLLLLLICSPAQALLITPNFDSSIINSPNATPITNAISSAIGTLDGLYSNNVALSVNFTYTSAGSGNLLSTTQNYYGYSYDSYTTALQADSAANPQNTTLASAVGHLGSGNDANGNNPLALAFGQALMLSGYGLSTPSFVANISVNINSDKNFAFTHPTGSSQYDLIGGLEHELNEVLGGGGAGSTLGRSNSFFTNKFGSLDLYRYSAPGNPGFTTAANATSYFSVDGGATSIVDFNQTSGGDYGDFAPACGTGGGTGQLIQNAFNCTGPYESYTNSSPEFAMLQAIGWDSALSYVPVPEPGSWALFGLGLITLETLRKRRKQA